MEGESTSTWSAARHREFCAAYHDDVGAAASKQWDAVAEEMFKQFAEGPTVPPALAMLDALHAALPFTAATGVLDDGCGSGLATDRLLGRYGDALPPAAPVIAGDFSSGLIEQVKKYQAEQVEKGHQGWARVETRVLDATDLAGLADGSLSHVMAGFVLFMVSDPQKALREARRVLQDGGVLAQTSWQQSDWVDIMARALERVRPDLPLIGMPAVWNSAEGIVGEMEKAGFRDVAVTEVPTAMAVRDPRSFADFMIYKVPMGAKYKEQMQPAEVARWSEVYAEMIREACPELPGELKAVSLVGVGRK